MTELGELDAEHATLICLGGTDPTGGAGLAADLRAAAAMGVFAAPVVTAVTAQTSLGVEDVVILPASVVSAQLDCALSEPGATLLKSGMLASEDIVLALAKRVRERRLKLVLDPVLVSTSGRKLLSTDGKQAVLEQLLPLATLVTPNLPEAEALTGRKVRTEREILEAADCLLAAGASAVLIKGGHGDTGTCVDVLRTLDGDLRQISRPRRAGEFRGTGCTLAAGIAAGLAIGLTLGDAVEAAREQLDRAMTAPPLFARAQRLLQPRHPLVRPGLQ